MIRYLFGLPFGCYFMQPHDYDKDNLKIKILENFEKQPVRNDNWSKDTFIDTNIHHSYGDDDNNNFNKIDFSSLVPTYGNFIRDYFKRMSTAKKFKYDFKIVNYTCTKEDQFMIPHIHTDSNFSFIHYLQFDKKQHLGTIFLNSHSFSDYLWDKDKLTSIFDRQDLNNSYLYKEFMLGTKEDMFIIFPSCVFHLVAPKKYTKERITVVGNININESN